MLPHSTTLLLYISILNRWSEYIEKPYQDDRGPPPYIGNGVEGQEILIDELKVAFKKTKNGKVPGPDDISAELIIMHCSISVVKQLDQLSKYDRL